QRLTRAAQYAAKPLRVFEDFDRGKVTPEGLDAAQTFVPDVFADFQMQLFSNVQDHLMRNQRLTQTQRLRIARILGVPAGADLRPETIRSLQANLMPAPAEPPPGPEPQGNGPVNLKVQQS